MPESQWDTGNIPDQAGKVAMVTGSSGGIGKETARVLASKRAKVVLAVRNPMKGEEVANDFRSENVGADVIVRQLDLGSLASVKAFAMSLLKDEERLDLLVNNAGVMFPPYSKTKDGFELQIGTNHLGHFALVGHLMPLLQPAEGSRIVVVSSMAHRTGNIDLSDLNWESRKFNTQRAYGDSKIANLYFAYELARKLEKSGGHPKVTAAHPGWTSTELQRHSGMMRFLNGIFAQDAEMGALPTLRAAFDPRAQPGDYFGPSRFFQMNGPPVKVSSNARSHGEEVARRLWQKSEEMTGISY